jgi:heat-inducible transcriptional repressor
MEQLSPRQQAILKLIVAEYVSSARPVGSDTVVEKYGLKVSPATIRTAMSGLESGGYIYHPHTSAGRVPSDRGYRFFVERLMDPSQVPDSEQATISHQFHQVELALDEWIELAASILSQMTHNAALATLPVTKEARLRHLELFSVQPRLALLVLVMQEGLIRKQIVDLGEPVSEDELSRVAKRLDEAFRGRTAPEIELTPVPRDDGSPAAPPPTEGETASASPKVPIEDRVRRAISSLMRAVDEQSLKNVIYDGITQLLNQPEFADVSRLRQFIELSERSDSMGNLVLSALTHEGVSLIIGEENASPELRNYSVALTRYGAPGEPGGVLGIIGPTRMRYDRTISSLRFVSDLLTKLWADIKD